MSTLVRGRSVRRPLVPRHRCWLDLERLDDRCLLSVVTLTGATETDYRTVAINYQVASSDLSTLTVDLFRSNAPQPGAGNQVPIGAVTLSGAELTPGAHDNVPLVLGERAPGVNALAIDPAHPYVIAEATGPDGLTSSADYRTVTIGLVTHGFDSGDTAPAWVGQIASKLQSFGYDDAIAFDWAVASHTLQSGEAVQSGMRAAQLIESYINGTNSQGQPNVPPGSVVDLQLIGHSRGSVVITQAMQSLQGDLANIPQAKGGYWELTYLDPHPSHGDNVAPFSTTTQALLDAANLLQTIFQDPYPLTVPSQVAVAQIYYENTPVSLIEPLSEEGQVNPWGITHPSGIQAAPGATTQFQQLNLTTPGMTHSGVYQWYQANVLPTLATASPFVTGPIDAPIVANGYNSSADVDSFFPLRVAYFSDLNPQLSAGDFTANINWGDQSGTSTGLVVGLPALGYYVLGIHAYSSPGTYNYTVTIQHDGGSMATASGTVNVTPATLVMGAPVGQAPLVSITQASNGGVLSQFPAFGPQVRGGVRVASADVNGDGTPDIIAATGPGTPGVVRVFDGKDHHLIRQFTPFGRGYRGGLTVSAGNMDSDGNADIAVASATGAIKIFSGADGSVLARFHARAGGASFRRGTGLTVADVDQDGLGDVVIAGPHGSTRHVITGRSLALRRANAQFAHLHHLRLSRAAAPESFLSLAGALRFLRVHR